MRSRYRLRSRRQQSLTVGVVTLAPVTCHLSQARIGAGNLKGKQGRHEVCYAFLDGGLASVRVLRQAVCSTCRVWFGQAGQGRWKEVCNIVGSNEWNNPSFSCFFSSRGWKTKPVKFNQGSLLKGGETRKENYRFVPRAPRFLPNLPGSCPAPGHGDHLPFALTALIADCRLQIATAGGDASGFSVP